MGCALPLLTHPFFLVMCVLAANNRDGYEYAKSGILGILADVDVDQTVLDMGIETLRLQLLFRHLDLPLTQAEKLVLAARRPKTVFNLVDALKSISPGCLSLARNLLFPDWKERPTFGLLGMRFGAGNAIYHSFFASYWIKTPLDVANNER
jgi:hypothetical protein